MFKLFNLFNWVQDLVDSFTFYGGGKGGGGGGGPQTQTSYSTNLPEYARPYYEELLKQSGKQIYTTDPSGNVTGVKEFTPYTGERVAGFTPEQQAVQAQTAGLTQPGQFAGATTGLGAGTTMGLSAGMAGLGQAFGYNPAEISGGMFTPGAASYYANPYQQNVTDIALRQASLQGAKDKTAGALGSIGRGTFGGARQALMQSEQQRNLNQQLGDIQAQGSQQGYLNAQQQFQADQLRRLQAAQLNQQGQQFQAGIGKDIGLAGLTAGLQGSQALGALGATTTSKLILKDLKRRQRQQANHKLCNKKDLINNINNSWINKIIKKPNLIISVIFYVVTLVRLVKPKYNMLRHQV
jgi:hypothetical protein